MGKKPSDRFAAWKKYRNQVIHPVILKPTDLDRARANLERHAWARKVLDEMKARVAHTLAQGPDHVERMVPATTPGSSLFTNCPVCEGSPSHGHYRWDPQDPDHLICTTCEAVYPNEKYPEDVAFRADRHGNGQVITFHGGKAFYGFGFHLHSSWTANIRARKVAHMASQVETLAEVYALTGERRYADKVRDILLRFAEVYPNYLVHSGYGEWIDLPPHVAAERINDLPEDEWTIPPNKPDRKLHSGYWNSGRANGFGMEGILIREVAAAYDLIHDVLTDDEREKIERDLLIESTVWLLADPALNNKSVTNLNAAGLVGMAVGDPGLVRAGAKGFWYFAQNWFLSDGTTSESPVYGLMTLQGMLLFGEALHGYSDPKGYRGKDRMTDFDLYGDGSYRSVFRAFYDTLYPNLKHPASADSYVPTSLEAYHVERMAARYGLPEYRALLRETLEGPVGETGEGYALFHRDPDFKVQAEDRVVFNDLFFPALRMGYLRMGEDGREGTVILDASHWGGHHHQDSLNLTLFQHDHEVLTDLGYLWDRPDKHMTVRTEAHNLVVVDEQEQRTRERKGSLHLFDTTPHVKAVDCSSEAYAQCPFYRRLCVWVDHGAAGSYLVDVFGVAGGKTHDYLFHGPIPGFAAEGIDLYPSDGEGPYEIKHVRRGASPEPWCLSWQMDDSVRFSAWALPGEGEEVIVGDGWGERGWGNTNTPDRKVDIPYVIRRRTGQAGSVFRSVFETHRGEPLVTGMKRLEVSGNSVALEIRTRLGVDVIVATMDPKLRSVKASTGVLETDGTLTVASPRFLYLAGGTRAKFGDRKVERSAGHLEGKVREIVNGNDDSYFVAEGLSPRGFADLMGRTILVDDGSSTTGYLVRGVGMSGDEIRLYTKRNGRGYNVSGGEKWEMIVSGYSA
ncbi:MAG: hypothetical protein EXS64_11660 [Candidatus Latescibacteria bacterium]|nr:hypothetical protein [Candidatus Latescibacterota bacterium]